MKVLTAVGLGLLASFVQSLGLTIQRRSHLLNERLPEQAQKSEWHRPAWIAGFIIFLAANLCGTIFQIGTLPIVILAPLGAVSLLYNAFLARILLNDLLSQHMILGSSLIAIGAALIGYFGAVEEKPHPLRELLELYERPTFVAFATMYLLVMASILIMAHLTEWQLFWDAGARSPHHRSIARRWRGMSRKRRSTPALATVTEVSENSSGIATPNPGTSADQERSRLLADALSSDLSVGKAVHGTLAQVTMPGQDDARRSSYGTLYQDRRNPPARSHTLPISTTATPESSVPTSSSALTDPKNQPTILALAVAYSAISGTMSGVCLLLAKSGVDLLVLTIRGQNQFTNSISWILITILFGAALLQLWYLNKSLKLADPVLVCPLAFCFYNISSITLGLVYFDELGQLSWSHVASICLGTALLLCGVWVISLHRDPSKSDSEQGEDLTAWGPGWHDRAAWVQQQDLEQNPSDAQQLTNPSLNADTAPAPHLLAPHRRSFSVPTSTQRPSISLNHALNEGMRSRDHTHITSTHRPTLYEILVERGLSIGLSPSSPGFHVSSPRRSFSVNHSGPNLPNGPR
ncbi:hypothetical protein MYAM1_002527 [Malassezia yamatoensis]|uniref:Uncharacterized protein n=1 Tax=Malassezia yamatoensis TaxID=253288 RepID=A0AAJ5YU28_9BASI|nr:hypothetical protein MYAM1_002527 [Malassezia yamatoensis]